MYIDNDKVFAHGCGRCGLVHDLLDNLDKFQSSIELSFLLYVFVLGALSVGADSPCSHVGESSFCDP